MRFFPRPKECRLRLDTLLHQRWPQWSRRQWQLHLGEGAVFVDGQPARKGQSLRVGQEVQINAWPWRGIALANHDLALELVYEDASLCVVNKPAGLPTHPIASTERETLANALVARYPELADWPEKAEESGLVHRLDNQTSGLLIVARSLSCFCRLREMIRACQIEKHYLAITTGHLQPQAVRMPLVQSASDPTRVEVGAQAASEGEHGRGGALTIIRQVVHGQDATLALIRMHRGFRHQIRAHCAALGHPLLGDATYGDGAGAARHMLHAYALAFKHPDSGKPLSLQAPMPHDMATLCAALGCESSRIPLTHL